MSKLTNADRIDRLRKLAERHSNAGFWDNRWRHVFLAGPDLGNGRLLVQPIYFGRGTGDEWYTPKNRLTGSPQIWTYDGRHRSEVRSEDLDQTEEIAERFREAIERYPELHKMLVSHDLPSKVKELSAFVEKEMSLPGDLVHAREWCKIAAENPTPENMEHARIAILSYQQNN